MTKEFQRRTANIQRSTPNSKNAFLLLGCRKPESPVRTDPRFNCFYVVGSSVRTNRISVISDKLLRRLAGMQFDA
jgi:hypothetical protein